MFDPKSTWSHIDDFEESLAEFFKVNSMQANIISPINGYKGRKVIFVQRVEPDLPSIQPQQNPGKPGAIQKKLEQMKGGK